MENFDAQAWYEDPVTTLVDGKTLTSGVVMQTVDAFGNENGRIRLASEEAVREVKAHMANFDPASDYRSGVRAAEAELFANHSAALIGN